MGKLILKGYVLIPDAELASVIEELPTHIKNTTSEQGCLVFDVSQDKTNKNKLNVYEEFVNKLAFESHQKRVSGSKWGNATKNCERHYEIIDG